MHCIRTQTVFFLRIYVLVTRYIVLYLYELYYEYKAKHTIQYNTISTVLYCSSQCQLCAISRVEEAEVATDELDFRGPLLRREREELLLLEAMGFFPRSMSFSVGEPGDANPSRLLTESCLLKGPATVSVMFSDPGAIDCIEKII